MSVVPRLRNPDMQELYLKMKMGQERRLRRSKKQEEISEISVPAWCQEHQGKRILEDTGNKQSPVL